MLRASDPYPPDVLGWAWHEWALPRRAEAMPKPNSRGRIALWTCGLGACLSTLALFAGFLMATPFFLVCLVVGVRTGSEAYPMVGRVAGFNRTAAGAKEQTAAVPAGRLARPGSR